MPVDDTSCYQTCANCGLASEARFRGRVEREQGALRAFDYSRLKEAARVAADAGPMQIQLWEEWVWRWTGDVQQSTAPNWGRRRVAEKSDMPQKGDLGKREKGIGWARRHKGRQRAEARKGFVMSMVVSCGDGIRGRWRTKLDLSSSKSFDDQHLPTTLGARPKITRTGGGDLLLGCGAALSSWKQSGKVVARLRLARKPKFRIRTKPSGSRCNRKRRKNSSSDRVINFCSLL